MFLTKAVEFYVFHSILKKSFFKNHFFLLFSIPAINSLYCYDTKYETFDTIVKLLFKLLTVNDRVEKYQMVTNSGLKQPRNIYYLNNNRVID